MANKKKKISEQEAALKIVLDITIEAEETWSVFNKKYTEVYGKKFAVEEESMAAFNLALAIIAQEGQSFGSLFPKAQADRIVKWIWAALNNPEYGDYATKELIEYQKIYTKSIPNIKKGANPYLAIANRLIRKWLGKNFHQDGVVIHCKNTGEINPITEMIVLTILGVSTGHWKIFLKYYDLFEGDIPLDKIH